MLKYALRSLGVLLFLCAISGATAQASSGTTSSPISCDAHAFYDALDYGKKMVVAGASSKKIYICGFILRSGGTAMDLSLTSGTGTDCFTTSTAITPSYHLPAHDKIVANSPFWNGLETLANGDSLCVNASADKPHQVEVWYTIQSAGAPPPPSTACTTNGSDGYAGAPSGTPQYATLLDKYFSPPTWCVAGVGYAVGPRPGTSYTAWTAYSHPGFSVDNTANHWIRCDNTDNVTLDGIDFSTSNGGILFLVNCNNITVKNSIWATGSNISSMPYWIQDSGTSCGLSVLNNDIDGGGTSGIVAQNCGALTVEYNRFRNFQQHVVETAITCPSPTTIVYKFNFIGDGKITPGSHENYQQVGCGTIDSDVEYNTSEQASVGGAEGFQFYCVGTCTMHSPTLSNNTMIAVKSLESSAMSYHVHGPSSDASTTLTGACTINNNYSDPTGAFGMFYPGAQVGCSASGNTNMNTGATIAP